MKRIFTIIKVTTVIGILFTTSVFAQAPQKMSYQAVIRNSSNQLVINQALGMRISILQGSITGSPVYTETQAPSTNDNGLVTIAIGTGTTTDDFSAINWASGLYFIKTETDPTTGGGTNYTITGTNQLLSVPYALHSKTAESITGGITETDPIFVASPANGITTTNISDWNTAFGWGNHATAGYLTGFTETDPIFGASPANGITTANVSDWNTAFGWGNHATAGYLTGLTEADPIFGASPANGITTTNISDWTIAFGWGNHASAGYLTSYTETDPLWTAASAGYYTKTNMQTSGQSQLHFNNITNKPTTLAGFGITDAMSTSAPAAAITNTNITNWNTVYGWGNHAIAGYLTSFTETDPIYTSKFNVTAPVNGQLLRYNSVSAKWENWTSSYLTAEVDGSVTNEIELPTQTGNSGKYLTTNGTNPSWASPSGGYSTHAVTSTSNYTIQAGDNVLISNAASPIIFTLPSAAVAGSGAVLYFYGIQSSFDISASQTIYDINGVAQTSLTGKYVVILVSDGISKWCQIH